MARINPLAAGKVQTVNSDGENAKRPKELCDLVRPFSVRQRVFSPFVSCLGVLGDLGGSIAWRVTRFSSWSDRKSSRGHEDELDTLLLKEHAKVPHFFR